MKKKSILTSISWLLMGLFVITSCEKPVLDEEEQNTPQQEQKNKGNLVLRVTNFQLVPYEARQTRAVQNITDYCSRFNFVIYKGDTKVKAITQKKEEAENYGEVSMTLEPGEYKVLVLAHSSRNYPSLANPEAIQFTNDDGYYDTFYYYDDITVTTEPQTHDLILTRASSMLRFTITDEIPSNVKYITLYYTGGSGVLNAVTGYGGNVNSKQTMLYNVDGVTAPVTLRIYTFLQNETGKLQLTVTAQDANKNTVVERKFTDVPMKRNMATEYTGSFFDHESENSFTFKAETDWEVYNQTSYSF